MYKRQAELREMQHDTARIRDAFYRDLDFGTAGPVSYTHLDVYKRQLIAFDKVDIMDIAQKIGTFETCLLYTSRCV